MSRIINFYWFIPAAMVNRNANGASIVLAQSSSLQFLQGEAAASSLLQVVLVCWTVNHWPQLTQRSGSNLSSLGQSLLAAAQLPGGLVEPGLDVVLPVLVEMTIGDDVVSFSRHFF